MLLEPKKEKSGKKNPNSLVSKTPVLLGAAVSSSFYFSYTTEKADGPAMKRLWDGGTLLEGIVAAIPLLSQDWS